MIQAFGGVLQNAYLLREVSVDRWFGGTRNRSMNLFCGASAKAYAACIFIRSETDDGKVPVNLVQAKSDCERPLLANYASIRVDGSCDWSPFVEVGARCS